jgi:hypothetical protein
VRKEDLSKQELAFFTECALLEGLTLNEWLVKEDF